VGERGDRPERVTPPSGQPAGTVGHALGVRGLSETQAAAVAPHDLCSLHGGPDRRFTQKAAELASKGIGDDIGEYALYHKGMTAPAIILEAADLSDAREWQSVTLQSVLRDRKASEFLAREYDLRTLGDVYAMERDGDSLNDLGCDSRTRETVRAALLKLRADRGWGPEEGYPAAWLEPAKPEPVIDDTSLIAPGEFCVLHDPDPDSLSVTCPHCGAHPGKPCFGGKGPTTPTHTPRHDRARREARKAAKRDDLAAKQAATTLARGRKALARKLRAEDAADRAAVESTPADGEGHVEAHERLNAQIREQQQRNGKARTVRAH
jgi:hypothetical protein